MNLDSYKKKMIIKMTNFRNSPDARAQAGIMFLLDRSRYHLLPFSGKDQVE